MNLPVRLTNTLVSFCPMQLYFIRHGQSQNNASWDTSGSDHGRVADPGLTELGHRQAACVAQFLTVGNPVFRFAGRDTQNGRGFPITHLYCSMMLRAVQTATPIASALNLQLVAWPDLHEHGGIYTDDAAGVPHGQTGLTRSQCAEQFPHLQVPDGLDERGWWQSRPYESDELYRQRAQRFLSELHAKHGTTDDAVAVVSHGAFYTQMMRDLLGITRYDGMNWFAMNNCAISRIDFDHGEPNFLVIAYQNRAEFLPRNLLS